MLRLVFSLVGIILIGLGSGYFMWGSRVAHLTDALNTMVLQQETLRSRLLQQRGQAAPPKVAAAEAGAEGEDGEAALVPTGSSTLLESVDALKAEVQFQAKLIDEQTRLMNRILKASEVSGNAALSSCQAESKEIAKELMGCRESAAAPKPFGAPGGAAAPGVAPQGVPGSTPPPPGPRY